MKKPEAEVITDKEEVLALVFRYANRPEGLWFPTPSHYPLQVGWHAQKKKRFVPLHSHQSVDQRVHTDHAQEFLYVEKGAVTLTITNTTQKPIRTVLLKKGDSILIIGGAHEVTIGPRTNILEVKQGPYLGDTHAKTYYPSKQTGC